MQSSCFGSLNIQNLWRCRCRRVVDLKLSNDEKDGQTWTCNFERRFRYRRVVDLKLSVNGGVVDHNIPYMEYYSHLLYSWRFSRYSAPIHWLVHGHTTPNNETVYRQMPWAGNLAKTMTSNGKQFTVTREMLTAVARDQSVQLKVAWCCRRNIRAFFKILQKRTKWLINMKFYTIWMILG